MKKTVYVTRAIWVACGLGIGLGWMQMMRQMPAEEDTTSVPEAHRRNPHDPVAAVETDETSERD